MDGVILTAAINGAEVTKADNPSLPITPDEVGEEALRCAEAGASIVHLHGRNPDGSPTQDIDTFRSYFSAVRDRSDIIVQFSTGGAVGMDLEERIEALALCPEMATLTTGTCNFGESVFENSLPAIRLIAERQRQFGITPEIEVFDIGMLDTAIRLVEHEGVLRGPLHVDFVLGVPGAMNGDEQHLEYLVSRLPTGWTWCVAGVGRHELRLARHALELGGHVRVGLEDNIYLSKGVLADGSHSLVSAVAHMAGELGRRVLTIAESRRVLRVGGVRHPVG
jgi:3-keto-5-aminohexanoate cleavage enzyme